MIAIHICKKSYKTSRREAKEIHLRARLKHKVSLEHAKLLESLKTAKVFSHGGRERRESVLQSAARAVPLGVASNARRTSSLGGHRPSSREGARRGTLVDSFSGAAGVLMYIQAFRSLSTKDQRSTRLLFEILQSLFHIEYLVLVEYVECIALFVYVIYSSARSQLPSDVYYPHHHDGDAHWSFLASAVLHAGLELLPFALLNAMYWWKSRFLPLYQLLFVLENQFELVQSKLVLWVVFLLQFELYHYGANFNFRFSWSDNNEPKST